ncbi:vps25 [Symbiodinium sp. CCMP2456]|nr:vps25 [Symbiodinium sp. CCMP2456]
MATDAKDFQFPPFYSLPPFFTLQPNATVRAKQMELWTHFVCDYCRFHRVFMLDISDSSAIFKNAEIQRQLAGDARKALAKHLVETGAAAWADDGKGGSQPRSERLLIFWRSPSAWADQLLNWAQEMGLIGSVETVQSLMDGEAAEGQEFFGAPRELIMVALQVELSERMVVDWASRSGIYRPKVASVKASNDRPEMNFGMPHLDEGTVKQILQAAAATQQRDILFLEVRNNLLKEERKQAMRETLFGG